jgi:hypothetical protein
VARKDNGKAILILVFVATLSAPLCSSQTLQTSSSTRSDIPISRSGLTNRNETVKPSGFAGNSSWGAGKGSFALKPQQDGIWRDGHTPSPVRTEVGHSLIGQAAQSTPPSGLVGHGIQMTPHRGPASTSLRTSRGPVFHASIRARNTIGSAPRGRRLSEMNQDSRSSEMNPDIGVKENKLGSSPGSDTTTPRPRSLATEPREKSTIARPY